MNKHTLFFLLIFSLSLFTPGNVRAVEYVFESGDNNAAYKAQVVSASQDLQYVFGRLSMGPDTVDYYLLKFNQYYSQVSLKLLIPHEPSLVNFSPSLIVADPNATHMLGSVPFGFPENLGGRVHSRSNTDRQLINTDQAFGTYWQGPNTNKDTYPTGYLIAVFDPQGRGGKYVLQIGNKTTTSGQLGILNQLVAWLRVKLSLY